jgi:hypothetical protein
MSDEFLQLIATAVVVLSQVYFMEPWKFPIFAKFWDWVAKTCGELANMLGWVSVHARANYFHAITEIQ